MREAVIVSTARTPIGKYGRGAFNKTHTTDMAGHAVKHAVERSGVDPEQLEDVILGLGLHVGVSGGNLARTAAVRAGLPVSTAGSTINRFCASGLQSIAMAAGRIVNEQVPAMVAGGAESISLAQPVGFRTLVKNDWLLEHKPDIYMTMINTAQVVADRYGVTRLSQDEYSLSSQERTAHAQEMGYFDDEIVPMTTTKSEVVDKETGETRDVEVTLQQDEGNRPSTTLEGLTALKPVPEGGEHVTAGNASQLSDGASACVVTDADFAEKNGLEPLGYFRGFAVAGLEPDEMGIGPVPAVRRLLERHNLTVDDIDLWELNEAFACQVVYCRDQLGLPSERLNVNGGGISIGHPFGMTGARQVGHILIEGRRRKAKYGVVTMCAAGGMGAAGLLEMIH